MSIKRPEYGPDTEIRRSKYRRRTVSTRTEGNWITVMVPDDLSVATEKQQANGIVAQVRKEAGGNLDNPNLECCVWLPSYAMLEDHPRSELTKWAKNISRRWTSVAGGVDSPGRTRISRRLTDVPGYVLGDVIVYELVHTFIDGGYTEESWYWAAKAPYHEQIRGYLEAHQRWGAQS